MKKLVAGMAAAGAILYPLVIYFGLTRFQPRYLALFLGALLLLKIASGRASGLMDKTNTRPADGTRVTGYLNLVIGLIVLALVFYTLASNQAGSLKLYPVVISFSLLLSFGWSLCYPPTVIEKVARITEPELSAAGVRYTRRITLIWCGFFLCNGLAALYTALYASFEIWALYNGLISYLLIACLLGGEFFYRHRFLKKG